MTRVRLISRNECFFTCCRLCRYASVILLAIFGIGCGLPGGTALSNEAVPSTATYLTGGNLSGSGAVSGTAQVYLIGGTVLLHLEGLVTPGGTLYAVFLENGSPSSPFYFSTLKATQGNQNYFTGRSPPSTHFTRVAIRGTASTVSTEMASSSLVIY